MQRKGDIPKRAEHGLEKEGLIHDPAEQHVAVTRIVQIGSEQMRDIGQHHPFVFFRNDKRVHVPAPVAVQPDARRELPQQLSADGAFPHAHCPAYEDELFLHVSPLKNYAFFAWNSPDVPRNGKQQNPNGRKGGHQGREKSKAASSEGVHARGSLFGKNLMEGNLPERRSLS
nr:hypothetical protein [Bilophila wadsworthia]